MKKILQTKTHLWARFSCVCLLLLSFAFAANAQVTATVEFTNPTCGGFTNGSATATGSGGWAPYTYQWSTGETTQSVFGLGAGTYSVTVTDMDLGFDVATFTLTSASQVDADITIDDVCAGNGNVSVPTTGGVPPYTYNWSDGGSGDTRTGLDVETQYCVTVLDDNLCGVVTCVVIPEEFTIDVIGSTVNCFLDCDGSVEVVFNGGTAPYSVLWDNGVTSQVNDGLPAGTYCVTVTDGNGCTQSGCGTIEQPDEIVLTVSTTSPPCGSNGGGSATVNATGGNGVYTYQWSTGATTQTVNNLAPGTYQVVVTDSQGCQAMTDVVITPSNQVSVNVTGTNPTCDAPTGGSATANPSGGVAPYSYFWNTGATTQSINNVGAGVYTVNVTDANGCTAVGMITLTQEGATINVNTTEVNATCGENNGSITANGVGGSGDYSYAWSTGATTQTITGVGAGMYTVTVTDNVSGCMGAKTVTITNTNAVNVSVSTNNTTCNANNGMASANAFNGTPPFTYAWSNGGSGSMINGLAAGVYTVTVTDANGCTATDSGTVGQEDSNIDLSVSPMPVSCFGGNDGMVGITVNGGVTPYTFAWSNGTTAPSLTNVTAGTYTVTVTDAAGCTASATATVTQPTQVNVTATSTSATCAGDNNGTATANANGGTPGYTYAWSNGANGQTITGLAAGTYTVTATDSNGCTATTSVTVSQSSPINVTATATPVSCNGGNDGTAAATANGGTPPFTFAWSNGATGATIGNLTSGTYTVTVTDSNGCTATSSATVTQPTSVNVTVTGTDAGCAGSNDGSATANTSGGTAPYTYTWSNGANTQTINNLAAGTYTVTVTDANGCTDTGSTTISENGDINVTTTSTATSCPGGTDGTVTANAAGGSAPYSYAWSNGANTQTVTGLSAGTYTVTVTDAAGCTGTTSATVSDGNNSALSCTVNTLAEPTTDTSNDGSLTVAVSGGSGNYTYAWSNGATTQTINNVPAGPYSVTVTDVNSGCTTTCETDLMSVDCVCDNFTDPGAICCDQTACGPGFDPAPITSLEAPSGGSGGPIEYLWMMKEGEGPFNQTQVTVIPNTNAPTYDPPVLYTTTTYFRCVRRGCCPYIETTGVTIFINDDADASFSGPSQNILCQGETYTYTANTTSTTAEFSWNVQGIADVTEISDSQIEVVWSSNGFYDVMLTVTDNACTASTVDNRLVTNDPAYCGNGAQGMVIDATVIHSANVEIELISQTGSADPNTEYMVERSKDGENFEEVAVVDMNGTEYTQFNDLDPMRGRSYYRVRMTQNGEYVSYSNTEEITIFIGNDNTMVYPNPFSGEINYEILDTFGEPVELEIISADGRVVRRITTDKDTFRNAVYTTDLADGVYFLRFNFSSLGVQTYKLLKQ